MVIPATIIDVLNSQSKLLYSIQNIQKFKEEIYVTKTISNKIMLEKNVSDVACGQNDKQE